MKLTGVAVALLTLTAAAEARVILRPPPPPPQVPNVGAELGAAIRKKDAPAVAALLAPSVENHGMWFSDAACARQFGKPGVVTGADRTAFARCLTRLKLLATTRKPSGSFHALLTFEPGIEIEMAVAGGRVQTIGFEAQTADSAGRPTLTLQAFEALRKSGSTLVDDAVRARFDPLLDGAGRTSVSQWMKVCIDATGAIDRAFAVGGSDLQPLVVAGTFEAAVRAWSFRPFAPGGKATPACALTLLTYPASRAPLVEQLPRQALELSLKDRPDDDHEDDLEPEIKIMNSAPPPPQNLPPAMLETYRRGGNKQIDPDAATKRAIAGSGRDRVFGSFKLCLDDTGGVSLVSPLKSTGFPAYDTKITGEMKKWTYRPYLHGGLPVPACTAYTFIYSPKP